MRVFKTTTMLCAATAIGLALGVTATTSMARANDDKTILVLDASGSMWGQIGGEAKIEIAQRVIGQLLNQMPEEDALGLYAYGHREKGNCGDIEMLVPAERGTKNAIRAAVNGLQPRGKTPLSATVAAAAEEMKYAEDRATVVLISDGRETCDQDPCAVAEALERAGADFTAHVIGFDVAEAEDIRQLSCIAEKTGGQFYKAADAVELVAALETVVVAPEPEPEPLPEPEPEPIVVAQAVAYPFVEEFDGGLAHWSVLNPNEDEFVAEAGELLLTSNKIDGLRNPNASSIITFAPDMPKGDWDMEVRFFAELNTGRDLVQIGLYQDHENYVAAQIWTQDRPQQQAAHCFAIGMEKTSRGEVTQDMGLLGGADRCPSLDVRSNMGLKRDEYRTLVGAVAEDYVTVTLRKRGRRYNAIFDLGDAGVYTTNSMSSIRSPGVPALSVGKHNEANGEVLMLIDRITITPVE
ncbi:MAG: VWA domain-containing protein [Pseudomonadota bacterium]